MNKRAGDPVRDRARRAARETRQRPGDEERQREAGRDGQIQQPELVTVTGAWGAKSAQSGRGTAAGGGGGGPGGCAAGPPPPGAAAPALGRTRPQPNDRNPAGDSRPAPTRGGRQLAARGRPGSRERRRDGGSPPARRVLIDLSAEATKQPLGSARPVLGCPGAGASLPAPRPAPGPVPQAGAPRGPEEGALRPPARAPAPLPGPPPPSRTSSGWAGLVPRPRGCQLPPRPPPGTVPAPPVLTLPLPPSPALPPPAPRPRPGAARRAGHTRCGGLGKVRRLRGSPQGPGGCAGRGRAQGPAGHPRTRTGDRRCHRAGDAREPRRGREGFERVRIA